MLLLALGLVMVLSTSSATAIQAGGSPYAGFQKQLLGVAGRAAADVDRGEARRRRCSAPLAYPMIGVSVLGLMLVLGRGPDRPGRAERWIQLGGLQIQPSEFAKLAFVLWGADLLARKEKAGQLAEWRHLLIPLLPGAAILSMLVMLGDDLGTTFILLVIFLALLWVIGIARPAVHRHARADGVRDGHPDHRRVPTG